MGKAEHVFRLHGSCSGIHPLATSPRHHVVVVEQTAGEQLHFIEAWSSMELEHGNLHCQHTIFGLH